MLELRSPREIKKIRLAGLVVWKALTDAAAKVAPGVTTAELDGIVEDVFRSTGAIPLFKGVSGPTPYPAATCISVNDEIVHGIPGPRTLRQGEIVALDTGCRLEGWCADSAITVPVGEISNDATRLLKCTIETLELAIQEIPRSKMWSDVARKMARHVHSYGFSVVEGFCGHGIGRSLHEDPQFPNDVSESLKRNDIVLRPGLVMAIEPMVNAGRKETKVGSDGWTQRTIDGKWSAHFEHTLAVEKDGVAILTGPPQPGDTLPW